MLDSASEKAGGQLGFSLFPLSDRGGSGNGSGGCGGQFDARFEDEGEWRGVLLRSNDLRQREGGVDEVEALEHT